MPLLRLEAITKRYDGKKALSGLSLSVHAGEWVGIVGESGSGKSTLLKIIGRFLDAEVGSVALNGRKLAPVREQLIKGHPAISMVQQEYELFPNQTAGENIAYALRFFEKDYREQKVRELLEMTRLLEVENHKAKLLSGGEKQRTALARALAEVPELLLLDEPFAHLDQRNKQTLAAAIEDLKRTHRVTCLFVTHDAAEALAWADRLVILKEGRVIQEGTPEEVYQNPANVYVAELTGQVNLLPAARADEWLMIRPNNLRVVKDATKARWQASIKRIRFKGTHYEFFSETAAGLSLIFYRNRKDRQIGDRVYLACSKKNQRTIPDRGRGR